MKVFATVHKTSDEEEMDEEIVGVRVFSSQAKADKYWKENADKGDWSDDMEEDVPAGTKDVWLLFYDGDNGREIEGIFLDEIHALQEAVKIAVSPDSDLGKEERKQLKAIIDKAEWAPVAKKRRAWLDALEFWKKYQSEFGLDWMSWEQFPVE